MDYIYWNAIRRNIWPFMLISLMSLPVHLCLDWIQQTPVVKTYFAYASLDPNALKSYVSVINEHIAMTSMSILLVIVFIISALHRCIYGRVSNDNLFISSVIRPIENFAAILAVAMLGIFIGLSIAAIFGGSLKFGAFIFTLSIFPLIYLVFLKISIDVVFVNNAPILRNLPNFLASRLDGVFLLFIGILILTYHRNLINIIDFVANKVQSWF